MKYRSSWNSRADRSSGRAALGDFGASEVDRECRRTDDRPSGWIVAGRAAELGLDARQELDHLERLGHVVVCAELQPDDLVDDLTARRQHDHRRLDALLRGARATTSKPTEPRQHHVEQDEVECLSSSPARGRSRRRALRLDVIAFPRQPVGEREHEAGLVLDEKQLASRVAGRLGARAGGRSRLRGGPDELFARAWQRQRQTDGELAACAWGALDRDARRRAPRRCAGRGSGRARRPGSAPRRRRPRDRTVRRCARDRTASMPMPRSATRHEHFAALRGGRRCRSSRRRRRT